MNIAMRKGLSLPTIMETGMTGMENMTITMGTDMTTMSSMTITMETGMAAMTSMTAITGMGTATITKQRFSFLFEPPRAAWRTL